MDVLRSGWLTTGERAHALEVAIAAWIYVPRIGVRRSGRLFLVAGGGELVPLTDGDRTALINHLRALYALRVLNDWGVPTVNTYDVALNGFSAHLDANQRIGHDCGLV